MLLLDFYVDEPACFGVPPYISPYCRYVAGALARGGVPEEAIQYLTVDQWRADGKELRDEPETVVIIAGSTVPGRYLGGKIGSVAEILEFLEFRRKRQPGGTTWIGGPIRHSDPEIREKIAEHGGILVRGDIELYAERLASHPGGARGFAGEIGALEGRGVGERRTYEQVDRWAQAGAFLTRLHPNFPYLMLELETYRGCTREVFCSFCTEAFYGRPVFRALAGILAEVEELARMGNRYFRLGRQADLMTYLPDMSDFHAGFPRPSPASIEALYLGLRRAAPNLKTLHLDNINPGLIAAFPEESREIARIISEYNTPGDTAAMGIESVDPEVITRNDLKCTREEALRAIEIINEYGARRTEGVPHLLPGLNFLSNLPGESADTFRLNYEFLLEILDRGLLLRRINIRQTRVYSGTKLERGIASRTDAANNGNKSGKKNPKKSGARLREEKFRYYRDKIRADIDQPMLELNFPPGSILSEVILEAKVPGYYLGRPLGSYPVTVRLPEGDPGARAAYEGKYPLDAIITGARERSLTALSRPIRLNELDARALASMPGTGKKSATRLINERPLQSFADYARLTEGRTFAREQDFEFR